LGINLNLTQAEPMLSPGMTNKKALKIFIIVFLTMIAVSPLLKYCMYELSGTTSKLRNAIGKEVVLQQLTWTIKERKGILTEAKYRWNDTWGFFDLRVSLSYTGENIGGHLRTGLSPQEAMNVKVKQP